MARTKPSFVQSDTQKQRPADIHLGHYPFDDAHPLIANANHYARATTPRWDIHCGFEIGILLSGRANRWQGSFRQSLTRGDMWLANSWEPHGFAVITPPVSLVVIILSPAALTLACVTDRVDLLLPFRLPPAQRAALATRQQKTDLIAFAENILHAANEPNAPQKQFLLTRLMLLDRLNEITAASARTAPANAKPTLAEPSADETLNPERIVPALNLVHDHPHRRITLAEAARLCHISPALLVRLFRKTMGISFADYARRRRLAALAAELAASPTKLASLARKFGFTDAAHLTRLFKTTFGTTPSHFRRHRSPTPE